MDTKAKSLNYDYLDLLRTSACLAVIVLHYSASFDYRIDVPTFNTGVQLFTLTRWCVPVFLMVSGALLLGTSLQPLLFFKKRFLRILPPFLFWSLVYLGFKLCRNEIQWNALPAMIRTSGAEFHLWYVYMILGIMLFVPFITPWTEKKQTGSLIIFLLIWLYWLVFFNQYSDAAFNLDLTYFGGYLGYLVLGYYLHVIPRKPYHWLIGIVLFLTGLIYSYYSTIELCYHEKTFSEYHQRYLSWNVMCMSAGVFLMAKQLPLPSSAMLWIKTIARYSFGIYLAHIFVRDNLVKNYFNLPMLNPYLFLLLKSILVMFFSYLISKALSLIPFVGKYISG